MIIVQLFPKENIFESSENKYNFCIGKRNENMFTWMESESGKILEPKVNILVWLSEDRTNGELIGDFI